jgi:cell division transport system permease protein
MITLPDNLFSPTFKQQKLGLLFAAIMAIMVYLATLAMALQVGIASTSLSWDQSQQGRLTVEVSPPPEGSVLPQADKIKPIMAAIKSMSEVESIRLLPEDEVMKLLQPWFKDVNLLKTMPLPNLIDIQLKSAGSLTPKELQHRLASIETGLRVDDHADWMEQLHRIVHALTALGWLLIALTGVALVIAISLICRTALAVEQRTIDLLHIMGATDRIIADTFARHTQSLSWPAALVGFFLALGTVGGLSFLLKAFVVTGQGGIMSWLFPSTVLLIVPCLAILGAVITARIAVLTLLRRSI